MHLKLMKMGTLSWRVRILKIWFLQPFQEYFTYIKPIVNQSWVKSSVSGEKTPDLPVQNLESHMYPE